MAIFFKEWMAGLAAGSLDDAADELYARDASTGTSQRVLRSVLEGLFAKLSGGNTFTGVQVISGDLEVLSDDIKVKTDSSPARIGFQTAAGTPTWILQANPAGDGFSLIRGSYAQVPARVDESGNVILSSATSVAVPAISGTSQAAQVTAYNAPLNQLAIGGYEIGDTEWRNISSSFATGWTGFLWVKRISGAVFAQGRVTAGPTAAAYVATIPAGFRADRAPWIEGSGGSLPAPCGPAIEESVGGGPFTVGWSGTSAGSSLGARLRILDVAGGNQSTDGYTWSFATSWASSDSEAFSDPLPGSGV